MSIQNIQVGDTVPIELQIADGAINQYPQALVYDQGSSLLQTVDLAHDNQGNYSGTAYTMPDTEFVKVVYIVYSNAGHTELNEDYERDIEVFYRILPDEFKATGFGIAGEYDARMTAIQLDLDTPDQYKATGFGAAGEYDTVIAAIQSEVDGLDGEAMRGTNGANTVVPPTVGQIDTEMTTLHGTGSWKESTGGMSEAELHSGLDSYSNKSGYQANVTNLDATVSSRAVPNEYDARMTAIQADLDNPNQYKATGFSIPNEYDASLAAIQADLDNPDQYKATGFGVTGEYDARLLAIQVDLDNPDQYKAIGFSVPAEYDARLVAIQADLDNPDQYKATGFGLAGEYDARMTTVQESLTRILGLTQENQFIDTTVHAGENLVSARLRLYSDAASVGTDLNVTDTYTITASYTAAGMETYSMVKV